MPVDHYGPNDEYLGRSYAAQSDGEAFLGQIVLLGIIVGGLYFAWETVSNWRALDVPYRYAAAFYYFIVGVPILHIIDAWNWLVDLGITDYKNLNMVLASIGMLIYAPVILMLVFGLPMGLIGFFLRLDDDQIYPVSKSLFFLPLTLSLLWAVLSLIGGWLFS